VDPDTHAPWRAQVYGAAFETARRLGARKVLDFGCRFGSELAGAFQGTQVQTTGADLPLFARIARERYPDRAWVETYSTDYASLEALHARASSDESRIFIVADVLEHVDDPRPLLRTLRRLLRQHADNRALIGVAARAATAPGQEAILPADDAHYREWSPEEIRSFLTLGGFTIEDLADTVESDGVTEYRATIVTVRSDPRSYEDFLAAHGLPSGSLEQLVLTSECHPSSPNARLGSYVGAAAATSPSESAAFCVIADDPFDGDGRMLVDRRWVSPRSLLAGWNPQVEPAHRVALEVTEQLAYLYEHLRLVEYQDFLGIGLRVSQARRAGLLPPGVRTSVRCHGTKIYDELTSRSWVGLPDLPTVYHEKIAVELSDSVMFHGRFLQQLYADSGYEIDPSKVSVEPYPFPFDSQPRAIDYGPVDTLIVLGTDPRRTAASPILEALTRLGSAQRVPTLTRLVLLQPSGQSGPVVTSTDGVPTFHELSGPPDAIREALRGYASHAICVVTDQKPDAPLAIFEVVNAGCPIIVVDGTGVESIGLEELVPAELRATVMSLPDAPAVATALRRVLDLDAEQRRTQVHHLFRAMAKEQATGRVDRQLNGSSSGEAEGTDPGAAAPPSVTMVIAVYRTGLSYVAELVEGLNQQSVWPDEILFVDDASGSPYVEQLEELLANELRVPHRVLRQDVNQGVAAARNAGLAEAASDIVITFDSDDIPKTDFVKGLRDYIMRNPGVAAVATHFDRFDDGSNWRDSQSVKRSDEHVGAAGLLGQVGGYFGTTSAAFDARLLRDAGGWSVSDRATAEDRVLWLTLTSLNRRIGLIPRANVLYRVRLGSRSTRHHEYLKKRMAMRGAPQLGLFDRLRMYALIQHDRAHYREYNDVIWRLRRSERAAAEAGEENRRLTRKVDSLRRLVERQERKVAELQSRQVQLLERLDRYEDRLPQRLMRSLPGLGWAARAVRSVRRSRPDGDA
jgi:glycosyltransferase involved in cell wall biosynthesis/SAM-dependent methyltransferase